MIIKIDNVLLTGIHETVIAAYPDEGCGLLVGSAGAGTVMVTRVVPSINVAPGIKSDRFEIDPQTRIDLERELRGGSDRVVGHFHSHPNGAAALSETDLSRVYEPDLIWLIAAVTGDGVGELTAWHYSSPAKAFEKIAIAADP